jgi:hypothetical protein
VRGYHRCYHNEMLFCAIILVVGLLVLLSVFTLFWSLDPEGFNTVALWWAALIWGVVNVLALVYFTLCEAINIQRVGP